MASRVELLRQVATAKAAFEDLRRVPPDARCEDEIEKFYADQCEAAEKLERSLCAIELGLKTTPTHGRWVIPLLVLALSLPDEADAKGVALRACGRVALSNFNLVLDKPRLDKTQVVQIDVSVDEVYAADGVQVVPKLLSLWLTLPEAAERHDVFGMHLGAATCVSVTTEYPGGWTFHPAGTWIH